MEGTREMHPNFTAKIEPGLVKVTALCLLKGLITTGSLLRIFQTTA